ncbi:transmembrane protein 242-like [Uranotaenia lowii]|uniref:transmembrane protein 242-like n=1 Tax=Uranotaenia lowii TaxID=190385 RepID=UPI0024792955|nr:transmembrane protein 242-like [Uranotaenia lowii]XP_055597139.1 transmembrane protein 242-like [Uranotaenia lowii]
MENTDNLSPTVQRPVLTEEERKFRFRAAAFLAGVAGASALAGFSKTLMSAKKSDPQFFEKGIQGSIVMQETGASLAMRALGWGTLYAVLGTGAICFGVWKMTGATNMKEFRESMGSILPRIPKNDPPRSRTEFEGLTDLMQYLSTWGQEDK